VLAFAFKGLESIRKSHVAQVGQGSWEVRLVPMPGFGRRTSNGWLTISVTWLTLWWP
jgi:hypothetical protein